MQSKILIYSGFKTFWARFLFFNPATISSPYINTFLQQPHTYASIHSQPHVQPSHETQKSHDARSASEGKH